MEDGCHKPSRDSLTLAAVIRWNVVVSFSTMPATLPAKKPVSLGHDVGVKKGDAANP